MVGRRACCCWFLFVFCVLLCFVKLNSHTRVPIPLTSPPPLTLLPNLSLSLAPTPLSSTLLDHYTLLYFGFSACPEICPTELRKLSAVYERLSARERRSLQMVFVTCDPWRDSVRVVREYVARFHPQMRGFTGTPAQVANICRQYRVYHSKPPRGAEVDTEDADYLVDHSIFIYLMDKVGGRCSV
jgi:cytochrome oxidase Cu insertion factor (SCO1/SenC/PrrC family)